MAYNTWHQLSGIPDNLDRGATFFNPLTGKYYYVEGWVGTSITANDLANDGQQIGIGSYPMTQLSQQSGVHCNGKGYMGNGRYWNGGSWVDNFTWWQYTYENNTWTQVADYPGAWRQWQNCLAENNGQGTKIYITGGWVSGQGAKNEHYEYDTVGNTWTPKAVITTAKWYEAFKDGFAIGDNVYCIGGRAQTGYDYATLCYSITNNSWSTKTPWPGGNGPLGRNSRYFGWAVLMGKGYGIGGGSIAESASDEFFEYDTVQNTWTQKANFGGTRRGFSSTNLTTGYESLKQVAAGGGVATIFQYDIWVWDGNNRGIVYGFELDRNRKYERRNSIRETI